MLRTVRASHAPLTRRPDPPHLSVLVVRPAAGAQTLLAAFARRRADRAGRGDALAHARRRRAVRGARVGGSSRCTSAGTSRAAVPRCFLSLPLLSPRRRSSSSSGVFSSVAAPCGARARRARGEGRRARRAYIAGGSRRRSSAGTSRAAVFFPSCSSLVPSPAVVLVSRLLFGRRSVRSEGATHGGRRVTRARRARRAYIAGGSRRRSSAGTSRAAVVLSSWSSSLVPSVAPRARRSFAPPARRRGARAPRAGA